MSPAFDSISAFLAMGGRHAPYVWSAWGLTVLSLAVLIWHARSSRQRWINEELARRRREAARQLAQPVELPSNGQPNQALEQ